MTAVPPVAARPAAVTAQQPVPPGSVRADGVPPDGAAPTTRQPAAPADDAAQIEQRQHTTGLIAGSALTGALFMGAGLAMCVPFLGFLVPFLIAGGIVTGVDFLADMAGFSPVKMLSGKSIGGWVASMFSSRPTEPQGPQGVNLRQPRPARAPVETRPLEPVERRDLPPADAVPATS